MANLGSKTAEESTNKIVKRQISGVAHLYKMLIDFVIRVHVKLPIEKVDILMFQLFFHVFPINARRFLRGGGRRYSPGVTWARNMWVAHGLAGLAWSDAFFMGTENGEYEA